MLASYNADALTVDKLGSSWALLYTLPSHHYFSTVEAFFAETSVPTFGASSSTIRATAYLGVIELGRWALVNAPPTHLD